jgi:hypothetical protein
VLTLLLLLLLVLLLLVLLLLLLLPAHLSFLATLLQPTAVHQVGHCARELLYCDVFFACLQQHCQQRSSSSSAMSDSE